MIDVKIVILLNISWERLHICCPQWQGIMLCLQCFYCLVYWYWSGSWSCQQYLVTVGQRLRYCAKKHHTDMTRISLWGFEPRIEPKIFCDNFLTLKTPRKPVSENFVCLCRLLNILANFSKLFCILAKSVDPDQIAPLGAVWSGSTLFGAIWSGSTLFAKMTFKITSRWHSRRQLLLGLAV